MFLVLSTLLVLLISHYSVLSQSLNAPVQVTANSGTTTYNFDLGNDQTAIVDIVSPTQDFSFTLGFSGNPTVNSEKMALKSTPISFFTFQVNDEASVPDLSFGAALRFVYNSDLFSVDPATLSFYQFRSDKWRELPDVSTVETTTKTLTQSFQREFLLPGVNQLGVWGGSDVTFPDDDYDYDLYDRYETPLTVHANVKNTFAFGLPHKGESFEMDILGANMDYVITVERHLSNPNPTINYPSSAVQGIYYFTITNANNVNPVINAVFRYKYTTPLPLSGVSTDSLMFYYVQSDAYKEFFEDGERDENVITQAASSLDDQLSSPFRLVLMGDAPAVPSPSPYVPPPPAQPSPSPSPEPSPSPAPSPSPTPEPSPSPSIPPVAQSSNKLEPVASTKTNASGGSLTMVKGYYHVFIVLSTLVLVAMVNRLWQ